MPWWCYFLRTGSITTTIPTHVNGFYLPTCAHRYLRTDKTQQNHKKNQENRDGHLKKSQEHETVYLPRNWYWQSGQRNLAKTKISSLVGKITSRQSLSTLPSWPIFSKHLLSNIAIKSQNSFFFPPYIRRYESLRYLISNIAILSPYSICQIPSKFNFTDRSLEYTHVNLNIPT